MTIDFTPTVWHDGVDGGTLVTAALLNGRETVTKSLVDIVNGLTSSTDPRREFAPENYGAVGDGVAIDRGAVQAAIDAANARYVATGVRQTVPITRIHLLDAVNYTRADGTASGAVSLMLKDGVELSGRGTLKAKAGAYGTGAFYAVIRSASDGLSNAAIRDITVDGNRTANVASTQCSNVVLEAKDDVEVVGIHSVNANGNGIMVRGATSRAATRIRITRNVVQTATSIGIQSSQFNGLEITGNTVYDTSDNAIDVYGENGSVNVNGYNFLIANNRVRNGLVGIFLETVSQGLITGNHVTDCVSAGVHVNRINGQPNSLNIVANSFLFGPHGARFTGDTGGVVFRNNQVFGTTGTCVELGGAGNVSYISIIDNSLDTRTLNGPALVSIAAGTNQAAFNRHRGTITKNTNRGLDTVNTATTSVSNVFSAANAA